MEVRKLIGPKALPTDSEALRLLKEYTLGKEMYRGVLVSEDATVCLIMVRLAQDADRLVVARKLRRIAMASKDGEKYFFGGMPFQMDTISNIMMRDMKHLIPLVSLLVLLTLLLGFRSLRGVLLPLGVVVMACSWTLGLMGAAGIRLTMISDLMPVLLIAIGTAYAIHIIHRYGENSTVTEDRREAARETIRSVGLAVIMAGLTTAIGFISFFSSSLSMIREFGLFTALGVFLALLLSLTFVPAVLSLLKRRIPRHMQKSNQNGSASRLTDRFLGLVIGHRRVVLAMSVVVVGAAAAGLTRITREVNMLEYFDPHEEIRMTEAMMKEKFGGSIPIQIDIRGDVKDPAVLRELLRLEKFLRTLPIIRHPQSVADLVIELNDVMNGRRTIPDTREGIENLWLFIEGQDILDQLIDSDGQEAVLQANIVDVDTEHIRALTADLQEYLDHEMNFEIVSVDLSKHHPEKVRKEINALRLETVAEAIERDLAFRDPGHKLDGRVLRETIDKAVAGNKWLLAGAPAKNIEQLVFAYLVGPEADVDMGSTENAHTLAAAVAGKAVTGPLSGAELEKIIRAHIPAEIAASDPEAASYVAEAISARLDQAEKQARLDNLLLAVKPLLPAAALHNDYFRKELNADLWTMNHTRAFVPRQALGGLVGGKKIAKSTTHFSASQTGMPTIFSKIDSELVMSQAESLLFSICLVFLLITFQFRSLKAGLLGIVPIVVTVATELGLMAYAGIALDASWS